MANFASVAGKSIKFSSYEIVCSALCLDSVLYIVAGFISFRQLTSTSTMKVAVYLFDMVQSPAPLRESSEKSS